MEVVYVVSSVRRSPLRCSGAGVRAGKQQQDCYRAYSQCLMQHCDQLKQCGLFDHPGRRRIGARKTVWALLGRHHDWSTPMCHWVRWRGRPIADCYAFLVPHGSAYGVAAPGRLSCYCDTLGLDPAQDRVSQKRSYSYTPGLDPAQGRLPR